jgi:hypothetical protein
VTEENTTFRPRFESRTYRIQVQSVITRPVCAVARIVQCRVKTGSVNNEFGSVKRKWLCRIMRTCTVPVSSRDLNSRPPESD